MKILLKSEYTTNSRSVSVPSRAVQRNYYEQRDTRNAMTFLINMYRKRRMSVCLKRCVVHIEYKKYLQDLNLNINLVHTFQLHNPTDIYHKIRFSEYIIPTISGQTA